MSNENNVGLPQPVATLHCNDECYVWARASEAGQRMRFEQPIALFTEQQLRALLATATGLPAQEPIAIVTKFHDLGGEIDWTSRAIAQVGAKLYLAPQAQADTRDADDADLIEWLSGQYLAADFQWGDPKTPVLVIEIPPTTSVCGDFRTDVRAAIAAAKGK